MHHSYFKTIMLLSPVPQQKGKAWCLKGELIPGLKGKVILNEKESEEDDVERNLQMNSPLLKWGSGLKENFLEMFSPINFVSFQKQLFHFVGHFFRFSNNSYSSDTV
jgi:hypothetical protein